MGIYRRWSKINQRNLDQLPDAPGAYELADRFGNVIDIGGSTDLSDRIPKKFRNQNVRRRAAKFRYVEDWDPFWAEAELQAQFTRRFGRRPQLTRRIRGEAYDILDY